MAAACALPSATTAAPPVPTSSLRNNVQTTSARGALSDHRVLDNGMILSPPNAFSQKRSEYLLMPEPQPLGIASNIDPKMAILSTSEAGSTYVQSIFQSTPQSLNLLITSFSGLNLPRTLNLPVPHDAKICDVLRAIHDRLPPKINTSLLVSTTSGKLLRTTDEARIRTLLSDDNDTFLPLRVTAKLCGGKGGFGSQLRAAGGRMSSKKNRDRQDQNGSNRNLDGRRLRTVDEAKRLADYLATKPDMDKKEKEERRKRWEAVIDAAEATEAKIKAGKMGSNQGRLDAEYVESKELAEERVREAVEKAMREQMLGGRTGSESSAEDEDDGSEASSGPEPAGPSKDASRTFFGWDDEEEDDDEDEDMSEDEDDGNVANTENDRQPVADAPEPESASYEGKGKGKAA